MPVNELPHSLDRSLAVPAPRALVFRHLADPERFARWWGAGSTIRAEVGGDVVIRHPKGIVARGRVVAVQPDRTIAFTYGYENAGPDLPPGRSLVTIELADDADGTRLALRHGFETRALRDQHVAGWRHHLAVLANVVANEHHRAAPAHVERWFAAWAEADAARRGELLRGCASDDVTLQDAYACCRGRDEVDGHIANCQAHAPGVQMRAAAPPRHCQGTLLVPWDATDAAGKPCGSGTHVMRLAGDGRIAGVVGFW
jgi:uncharacterized protein YndB with AHSA1/START domain